MADNRKLLAGLLNLPRSAQADLAQQAEDYERLKQADYLRKMGDTGMGLAKSVARGVPQMATGLVDLAAMPFEAAGLVEPGQAVGSTKWLESKGYLPESQEGFLNQTAELLSGGFDPSDLATKGLPLLAGIGKTVWHGSPHSFEKFDLSKIGTGEGAQAYGHGLYLADAPEVAKEYQNMIRAEVNGKSFAPGPFDPEFGALNELHKSKNDYAAARKALEERAVRQKVDLSPEINALNDMESQSVKANLGSLYKVDLPDEQIAKMLDWDKPLSEQPEILGKLRSYSEQNPNMNAMFRESLSPMEASATTGDAIYRTLSRSLDESKDLMKQRDALYAKYQTGNMSMSDAVRAMSPEDRTAFSEIAQRIDDQKNVAARTSGLLNELGIPGIRYLDQGSRGAGEGTSNYVVFSDEIPQILERNGQPIAQALREYRGAHSAPGPEFGAQLHDITGGGAMYPEDIYSAQGARIYGHGGSDVAMDKETMKIIQGMRNRPDEMVDIYRAVPNQEEITSINPGDWITINPNYAKQHGESNLPEGYKILQQKVPAKSVWTNADSIHEYGYWPE